MNWYVDSLLRKLIAGIPADHWTRFFKLHAEARNADQILRQMEKSLTRRGDVISVEAADDVVEAIRRIVDVFNEFGRLMDTHESRRESGIDRNRSCRCDGEMMKHSWAALISRDRGWWIGWIAEISGVNAQERKQEELLQSLTIALREAVEMNRQDAAKHLRRFEVVAISA